MEKIEIDEKTKFLLKLRQLSSDRYHEDETAGVLQKIIQQKKTTTKEEAFA